jgi:hypothetical protein
MKTESNKTTVYFVLYRLYYRKSKQKRQTTVDFSSKATNDNALEVPF